MVRVPGELPGAMVPPERIVVLPNVPLPARLAPLATLTLVLAKEPLTTRRPASMEVSPV
jgi:hypothetical protein